MNYGHRMAFLYHTHEALRRWPRGPKRPLLQRVLWGPVIGAGLLACSAITTILIAGWALRTWL
ncbi:MAG: hypothetical protein KIT73_15975 [Burkholderiales bacterium]|nr:hypothetical protein [Burkholderiales bacterium]